MAPAWTTVREILVAIVAIELVLGGLLAYTHHWPPAVIVESSSMMRPHEAASYGNVGTIDPGDLVLVQRAAAPGDVTAWTERSERHYGDWGDVIVYYDEGDRTRTPVIHRAMAWVDARHGADGATYAVSWAPTVPCPPGAEGADGGATCIFGPDGVTIPQIGIRGCAARCSADGWLTRGDNPGTNPLADQATGIATGTVEPSWIAGRARGEIPWLGLIRLAVSPTPNESPPPPGYVNVGNAWAPGDLWVMLGVTLALLVVVPVALDNLPRRIRRRDRNPEARPPKRHKDRR